MIPLVSVLIPTYNRPVYFELALKSVLNQTYKNIEIIIGDDSTNNETEELVKNKYLPFHKNITYIKNKENLGQFDNALMIYDLAGGEYINFLMDDDLFHPRKIEKMMICYLIDEKKKIKLVTSHRQLIDIDGENLSDLRATVSLVDKTTVFDGKILGKFVLDHVCNFIGEPTTVLFRKEDLVVPFGTLDGRRYSCCVDVASWLNLMSQGDVVYISESLSYFRFHPGQQQNEGSKMIQGFHDFYHAITLGREYGFFTSKQEEVNAMNKLIQFMKEASSVPISD